MGNTERILCPGAPEGPAWFHTLQLGDQRQEAFVCDVYNRTRPLNYSGETFQRVMLCEGWLDHLLELCGSHGAGVWLPVLLCHPQLVLLFLCVLGAGAVES